MYIIVLWTFTDISTSHTTILTMERNVVCYHGALFSMKTSSNNNKFENICLEVGKIATISVNI